LGGHFGLQHPEWEGSFYPDDLPAKKCCRHAARFPTVEINYTFYRMPTEKLVAGWAEPSPYKLTLRRRGGSRTTNGCALPATA
jgi:uncharacterized protein YecE (DUF72 family)